MSLRIFLLMSAAFPFIAMNCKLILKIFTIILKSKRILLQEHLIPLFETYARIFLILVQKNPQNRNQMRSHPSAPTCPAPITAAA